MRVWGQVEEGVNLWRKPEMLGVRQRMRVSKVDCQGKTLSKTEEEMRDDISKRIYTAMMAEKMFLKR